MLLRRTLERLYSKPVQSLMITRVWASDGWCYIPEMKQRQKFFEYTGPIYKMEKEEWHGVIPSSQHSEQVMYSLHSSVPLVWSEQSAWGCETFEEQVSIQNKSN